MADESAQAEGRSIYLTIWLALVALGCAYGIVKYGLLALSGAGNTPIGELAYPLVAVVVNLAIVASLVGIWRWKRSGFEYYGAAVVAGALLSLGFGAPMWIIGVPFVLVLITYLVMRPQWERFEIA